MSSSGNLRKSFPSLYPIGSGPVISAIVEAIGEAIDDAANTVSEGNDQAYTETASGSYLDALGENAGVERPPVIGMGDGFYRKLIPTLSFKSKQVRDILWQLLTIWYGDESVFAHAVNESSEPYSIPDGSDLIVSVSRPNADPGIIRIRFDAADFTDISSASADEVADLITKESYNLGIYARSILNPSDQKKYVAIFSQTPGPKGALTITGGSAQPFLKFKTMLATTQDSTTEWTIDAVTGSTVRLTYTGTGASPTISLVREGDILVLSDPDNTGTINSTNRGSFAVTAVGADYVEYENSIAEDQSAFVQGNVNTVFFFRPYKTTILDIDVPAVVYEVENNLLEIFIPQVSAVISANLIGSAHLNANVSGQTADIGYPSGPQFLYGDSLRGVDILYLDDGTTGGTARKWNANTSVGPSERIGAAMVYSPTGDKFVMHGGLDLRFGTILNDTWEYDASAQTWSKITETPGLERMNHSMAYDPATSMVLLFGGEYPQSTYWQDLWSWDGAVWTSCALSTPIPVRSLSSLARATSGNDLFLFGGTDGTAKNDTWQLTNTAPATYTSTLLSPGTSPSARSGHAAAFNSGGIHINKQVLFGGYNGSSYLNDTWTFDGTTWTQVLTAHSPSARYGHALFYDSNSSRSILFGGITGQTISGAVATDTWTLTSDWAEMAPKTPPAFSGAAGWRTTSTQRGFLFTGQKMQDQASSYTLTASTNYAVGGQFVLGERVLQRDTYAEGVVFGILNQDPANTILAIKGTTGIFVDDLAYPVIGVQSGAIRGFNRIVSVDISNPLVASVDAVLSVGDRLAWNKTGNTPVGSGVEGRTVIAGIYRSGNFVAGENIILSSAAIDKTVTLKLPISSTPFAAGDAVITHMGDWLSASTYRLNDVVIDGGAYYKYIYATPTSGNLTSNATYWAVQTTGNGTVITAYANKKNSKTVLHVQAEASLDQTYLQAIDGVGAPGGASGKIEKVVVGSSLYTTSQSYTLDRIVSMTPNTFLLSLIPVSGLETTIREGSVITGSLSNASAVAGTQRTSHAILERETDGGSFLGAYLYDTEGRFSISKQKGVLASDIDAGTNQNIVAATMDTDFTSPSGYVVFDFGRSTQEGPVSYYGVGTGSIKIDPAYTFQYEHPAGNSFYRIFELGPPTVDHEGAGYAAYVTDTDAAIDQLKVYIKNIVAAGVKVNITVEGPDYRFL